MTGRDSWIAFTLRTVVTMVLAIGFPFALIWAVTDAQGGFRPLIAVAVLLAELGFLYFAGFFPKRSRRFRGNGQ